MFSWLSIISGAFSAIGRALGLIHDANERTAGANQVIAKDNAITTARGGFSLKSTPASISGVVSTGGDVHVADAAQWNDLAALTAGASPDPANKIVVGRTAIAARKPVYISLQRTGRSEAEELAVYRAVRTDRTPAGLTGGSRALPVAGSALYDASQQVIEKGRNLAAHLLETAAADVQFADAAFVVLHRRHDAFSERAREPFRAVAVAEAFVAREAVRARRREDETREKQADRDARDVELRRGSHGFRPGEGPAR